MFDPERVLAALYAIENGEGIIYLRCIQCRDRLPNDQGLDLNEPTICEECSSLRSAAGTYQGQ